MKEIKIDHLVYLLKEAKKNKQPQPIFFLGAGASSTGNIPLAGEITKHILSVYADSPFIQDLNEKERTYSKLMDCLQPDQRDELLKDYINKAKINVTHIYLAQLLKEGYVDYILTVNFDNLILRALAMFNIFPSAYDMAILKDLTTTTFKEKSVVYLHGQSHGLWLLNTPDEMGKVVSTVPRIFDTIKNKRPWIFIGYSGEDPIFDHVKNLGRFNNGLYWVTYHDSNPNSNVMDFLSLPNTNGFLIKGYDSDSFMLKLTNMLDIEQPNIINKPFTALKDILGEIVDIEDKEHFKGVRKRMGIAYRQVNEAINQYEKGISEPIQEIIGNTEADLLKKDIINILISEKYDEAMIANIESRAKELGLDDGLDGLMADLYQNWANSIVNLARTKYGLEAEVLYNEAIQKFLKASDLKPNNPNTFNNWGNTIAAMARFKSSPEAEELYCQAIEKYKQATDLNPNDESCLNNWANTLGNLARFKSSPEAEELYCQAIEKYKQATNINPDSFVTINNWGTTLSALARIKSGSEAEELYCQAIEKYKQATELHPDYSSAFNNWGADLGALAKFKSGSEAEALYYQAIEKYKKATELNPYDPSAFDNWGLSLMEIYKNKSGKEAKVILAQAFDNYGKAIERNGSYYNMACALALIGDKGEALYCLEVSLIKGQIMASHVRSDEDWKNFYQDEDFINLLKQHSDEEVNLS